MALVNLKSTAVTNDDAIPVVRNARILSGAPLYVAVGEVAVGATDDVESTYRFARLPSNAIIYKIDIINTAITTGTDFRLGLYNINDGTAVFLADGITVAKDLFGTIDVSSARALPVDINKFGLSKAEMRLYELLDFTTDTSEEYDLTFTAAVAPTGAGDISLKVYYSV